MPSANGVAGLILPAPVEDGGEAEGAAGGGRVPEPSALGRLWHGVASVFSRARRERTPREQVLWQTLQAARGRLHEVEQDNFRLKTQIELEKSEIVVLRKQVELMAKVHEMDRARVEADTAAYLSAVAQMEARRQRGE